VAREPLGEQDRERDVCAGRGPVIDLSAEAATNAIASGSVAAEPVRISCLPVAVSTPPKIRT
jgi:hypothetical protein